MLILIHLFRNESSVHDKQKHLYKVKDYISSYVRKYHKFSVFIKFADKFEKKASMPSIP